MPGNRKNKLHQHRTFISNTTGHSNFLQAEQNIASFRWRSDQLFAINHGDLREIRSPSLFSSLNHSLTGKGSDLPCLTQERE